MNLLVIESTTPHDNGQGILLPWPCSIEDLRRSIGEAGRLAEVLVYAVNIYV
jgi:hypothetical protein